MSNLTLAAKPCARLTCHDVRQGEVACPRVPLNCLSTRRNGALNVSSTKNGIKLLKESRAVVFATYASKDGKESLIASSKPTTGKLVGSLVATATVAAVLLTYGSDYIQDNIYGDGLIAGPESGITFGDFVGASLWGVSLYFCSPLQLLLLFIGDINTERPSDWMLRLLGSATGQPVSDVDYVAPVALQMAVIALCGAAGAGLAWAFRAGLGDATWSVSTGLGACVAAAVYEVGRPQRFSPQEASEIDEQWRAFVQFARERLQPSGGCHQREIVAAFRRSDARFQDEEHMPSKRVREFVRNWHPDARLTPNGFWKGVSLQARTDPFTGSVVGTPPSKAVQKQ